MGYNISLRVEGEPWDSWHIDESQTEALLSHCGIDLAKAFAPVPDGINRVAVSALLVKLFQEEEKMAGQEEKMAEQPAILHIKEQREAVGNMADILFRFWQITLNFPDATLVCAEMTPANQAA